jgi:hypothetical protein
MGISRIVNTDFWTDSMVIDNFTVEDRYFMLYLLTNPHSKQAGIYKLNKRMAAFEMGYSLDTVSCLLERFEKKYNRIVYSEQTQEIAILNYIKHSIVTGGKPVLDCIERDLSEVKDKRLIAAVYEHMQDYFESTDRKSANQIGDIFEKFLSNDNENDNDNDNDNDRTQGVSCSDSCSESYNDSLPEKPKKTPKTPKTGRNSKNTVDMSFIENEEIRQYFQEFADHRKQLKKPMTQLAAEKAYKRLCKMYPDTKDQITAIEQAIAQGWLGIYPIKDQEIQPTGDRRKEVDRYDIGNFWANADEVFPK